jgi:putative oxidoreductase
MADTAPSLSAAPDRTSSALAVIRIVVGVMFAAHGAQKLFVFGIGGVVAFFTKAGIPLPAVTAPLVTFVELLAGLALVAGLLTRLGALGLAIDMVGAMLLVHLRNGFFLPQGFEYTFVLLGVLVGLMLSGPGAYSLDAAIARRKA